jgi:TonB family protein
MRFKFLVRGVATFLIGVAFAIPAILTFPRKGAAQQATKAKPQAAAISAYPESAEGLKSLLQDWFAAIIAGDEAQSSQYLESFAIPNHQEWFRETFGPVEGARLEAKYTELQAKSLEWLEKSAELGALAERISVEAGILEKSAPTQMRVPTQALMTAMVQPTPVYYASSHHHQAANSFFFVGNFVFVDGAFRYLDERVMQALSTAPPMRVKIPRNVLGANLIHRVEPVYPQDAKIKSTVVLHVIIATDGTMKEIQLVSGHPLLFQAAFDAVKQWRYKPILLNGIPVEVDTQIEIEFSPPN